MYYTNVTRFHKQGRFDFLNTTFCGKFIANKWNLSINDTLIHQQNEYLKIFTVFMLRKDHQSNFMIMHENYLSVYQMYM